jgi:agmatinase
MDYPDWNTIKDSLLRGRNVPMIDSDMPTFLGQPHAISEKDLEDVDAVIIGAPYVASWGQYGGVNKEEWIAATRRVRQQSVKYSTGYIQEFDIDVLDHLRIVDFGDAEIPVEVYNKPTVSNILEAQAAVEKKVNQVLDADALPKKR